MVFFRRWLLNVKKLAFHISTEYKTALGILYNSFSPMDTKWLFSKNKKKKIDMQTYRVEQLQKDFVGCEKRSTNFTLFV